MGEDFLNPRIPIYPDGKSEQFEELTGVMLQITSGGRALPATIEQLDPTMTQRAVAWALYSHPAVGQDRLVALHFDVSTWKVAEVVAHLTDPRGRIEQRPVEPKADAVIKPLMSYRKLDGSVAKVPGAPLPWGEGPELIVTLAAPGEHAHIFEVEAITGASGEQGLAYNVVANAKLDAYLKSGPLLTPQALVGTWKWELLAPNPQTGEAAFRDIGTQTEFQLDPSDPRGGKLLYHGRKAGGEFRGEARLDTRGLPLLSLYIPVPNPRGGAPRLSRAILGFPLYQAGPGAPTVMIKDFGASQVLRLVKQ